LSNKGIRFVLILFIILIIVLSPSIFQEGYPIPIIVGIAKLHLTDETLIKVSDSPERYLTFRSIFNTSSSKGVILKQSPDTEWNQDIIKDGKKYRTDWKIYLGKYKIYEVKSSY